MTDPLPSSTETGSHDAVRDQFLRELDQAPDAAVDTLLTRAIAAHPERADEFRMLAAGITNLRGLRDPERLGPYTIRRVLAIGGMGKLYEADEDGLDRVVAVKTIKAGRAATSHLLERFDRERQALARLHHTNIVPIYATGQESGLLCFSMPRIHGPTLRALIRTASAMGSKSPTPPPTTSFDQLLSEASAEEAREQASRGLGAGPTQVDDVTPQDTVEPEQNGRPRPVLPPDYRRRVALLMADVAEAVHHAHEIGVVHRDLKPANILVERHGHPWVLDFGLAHFHGHTAPAVDGLDGNVRLDGATVGVGTPLYWAPEQVPPVYRPSGSPPPPPIDRRTDVWALGVILYELLTLHRPFSRVEQILNEPLIAPRRLIKGFDPELEAICLKALAKNPDDRYETALVLANDLRRWVRGEPSIAGRASPLRRAAMWARRRPSQAALFTVLPLAILVASSLAVYISEVRAERAQERADAAQRQRDRDREVLRLPELRRPTRRMGWFEKNWEQVRSLRAGGSGADEPLQAQAAAALEGFDARIVKSMPWIVPAVEFDPRSERLLILREEEGEGGRPHFRTVLWERTTDRVISERNLGWGVPAFRPDGTPLQASFDPADRSRVRVFNAATGEELRAFRGLPEGTSLVGALSLSRDGSRLAAVAHTGQAVPDGRPDGPTTLMVWDASTERPLRTLAHKATQDILLSADGRLLAAWDALGEITVWTLPDGAEFRRFRVGRAPVNCLAFGRDPVWYETGSPPSGLLAVGESSGLITVWDLRDNRPRSVCRGSEFGVYTMDFSADGAYLLSAGRNDPKLWDVATGNCLLNLWLGDYFHSITLAPDGHHVAASFGPVAGQVRAELCIAELERGHGIDTLHGLQGGAVKTAFSPDGRLVAAASHEWQVGIWEVRSRRLLGILPTPIGRFVDSMGLAFDADGRRFACSVGHQAKLWDLERRQLIRHWELPEGLCDSLAFSGNERLMLVRQESKDPRIGPFSRPTLSDSRRVARVYDLLGSDATRPINDIEAFDRGIHDIQIASDGAFFAVEGVGIENEKPRRRFHLYKAATGELVRALPTKQRPEAAAVFSFDPSGRVLGALLVPAMDGALDRFDLFDVPALNHRGPTERIQYGLSPSAHWGLGWEGRNARGEVILTDVTHSRAVLFLDEDVEAPRHSYRFRPDGRLAMVGRKDGTVSVLDLVEINRRLSALNLGW